MSLSKRNVDRCLQLLWECRSHTELAEQRQAYGQAISSLHAYLTDVLPATLPCVRANAQHGVIELFQDQGARAQDVDLILDEGDKLGIVLDKINVNEWSGAISTASPIAISLIKPHSVAGKENRLARGDQVLSINGHSLSQVSLQRARWLLDSAERSQKVSLSIITSGLLDGLKHSISRHDVNSLTPQASHRVRSRSRESLDKKRVQRLLKHRAEPSPKTAEKNAYQMQPVKPHSHSSVHNRPGFAPSIGSRHGSDYSLVSSTVETAAHIARSSTRSSRTGASLGKQFKKRKVRKMHIMKGARGLGLRIIGGKGSKYGDMGIFVRQLEEGGAAFNDQRLHPGDELLMVDGKTLVGLTHDEAVAVLTATQKLVQLVVATEHNIDGESIDSSMQSIPEKMINLAGIVDRQVESRQSPHAMAATDAQIIAPEFHKSPLRNTFQSDEFEMKALGISAERPSPEVETSFYDGNVRRVEVKRSEDQPLGFSIRQGSSSVPTERGIFIHAVDPHGAVGRSNQLQEGDQLLKANEISLDNCTREEALDVLTALKGDIVTFEVLATKEKQILLHKTSGQPLGIQLTSSSSSAAGALPGVTIKKIAVGSPADASGKLCVGDQLVSVNGMSLFAMNVEQVKGLLASIPGEEIKLVVLGCHNLPSRPKKTRNADDVDTIEVGGEMDFGVTASPEAPESPPPLVVADSEPKESGSSDEDSIGPTAVIRISQRVPSRPESSFIEIAGDFQAPESPQSAPSAHASSTILDQPPTMPDIPPPDPPSGLPQVGGPQPPDGFLALQFSIKKRPRGDLGVTLVASGTTTGYFMVRRVTPNGAAAKDGRLQIGDRLVSVNGESLHNVAHAAILQALKEAVKDVTVVAWRDPYCHLASSSMHSLGSNLSGSRCSLHSEDINEGSPSLGAIKRRKGLHSPAAQNSPLVSYAGIPSSPKGSIAEKRWSEGAVPSHLSETKLPLPPNLPEGFSSDLPEAISLDVPEGDPPDLPEVIPAEKRLDSPETIPPEVPEVLDLSEAIPPEVPEAIPPEVSDVLPDLSEATPPDLPETIPPEVPDIPPDQSEPTHPETFPPEVPEAIPPEVSDVLPDLSEATPPDVPETIPPEVPGIPPDLSEATPPDVPEAIPPDISEVPPDLPDVPPDLPEAAVPEVPSTLPLEIATEVTMVLPEIPTNMTPPGTPSALTSSPATTLDSSIKTDSTVDSRPRSLQVPRGRRTENTPFEIELKKSLLGIGVSLTLNEMGMLVFTSISSRSVISQDGNIKVGDQLLSINDDSVIGLSVDKAEALLKGLPRGLFWLTVMAPFKDVSGELKAAPTLPQVSTTAPTLPQVSTTAPTLATSALPKVSMTAPTPSQDVSFESGSSPGTCKENIVEETLQHSAGCSLGFDIEGGSDTPLNYIYIKSLIHDSPASNCGQFNCGDQLVMVGDTCLIGLSYAEAASVLDLAPATVTIVAQRKAVTAPTADPMLPSDSLPAEEITCDNNHDSTLVGSTEVTLESAGSTDDLQASVESERAYNTQKLCARKTSLIPEEKMTVELTRRPGEKLGIGIIGGIDNPNLRHIHVKQVTTSGAAARDGRIKKGDRIISVNDLNITGMSNKQALQTLKEAGDHVTLAMSRKVGRRQSRTTTPLASARHSRQGSGEISRAESRMSPQRSPRNTLRRLHSSSDEGSRDSSRGPSPQHPRKHYRRKSVTTAKGEILTFTDRKSTLPRKIKGAKLGVQLVELHKGPTGLGIQLQGSADGATSITVKAVLRGGPASRSGKVRVGDEIIEVNGTSFEKLSQQEALKIMKDLPQGKVSIILRDPKALSMD